MPVAPHGTWPSPITPALAAAGAVRVGGLCADGGAVYWVEGRPAEHGRNVVVRRGPDGTVADVTPPGFNVRTRVHEYGGGAFTVRAGTVYFSNDADGRLWCQDPGAAPRPLTPEAAVRFADLAIDERRGRLVCVREDHRAAGEPPSAIVAVPLGGGEPQVLIEGPDFLAAPRLSPDGDRLVFLRWSHPHMPWEETELCVASLDDAGRPGPAARVAGGPGESVVEPRFSPAGVLHFVSDRSGFWNLHRLGPGGPEPLCPLDAEFAGPAWVFGLSSYAFLGPALVACAFQRAGTWHLGLLDTASGQLAPVETTLTEIAHVQADGGRALFVGGSPNEPTGIFALTPAGPPALLHRTAALPVDPAYLSRPEAVTFPTAGGAVAHGLHYPPRNPDVTPPPGERPPLLVMSHGGPTAAASTALSLPLQFWTSRGFAVLDVNYRGSTGYGRAFRRALEGAWGVADVEDCVAGARHLAERGLVDGERLLIRGGSAGGYTTLAALTFQDVFRAGASYYGVSDLEALARDTHKFESRYLDSLIGPHPARRDLYVARSPIHHADRLARPVIFFQGLEDKVVPPDQAARMVDVLRAKGVPVEYVTFPDEQHGFRRADNIARALEAELVFYQQVLGLAA